MNDSKAFRLPQLAFYEDTELEIDFPDSWDIVVCKMHGHDAPPLTDDQFRAAFANPIGTKTIKELAKGKKDVVILFDDLTRPTPASVIVPYVLEELAEAGIPDDNIRFIAAIAAHGAMDGIAFRKKLGDEVVDRFPIYNHNPYENVTPIGTTSYGTPVSINSEFMSCDLKIGIGCISPHPCAGFGGGSKIIVPGVASMQTIEANHYRLIHAPEVGVAECACNAVKQDMDEAAKMAGLDVKIDAVLNIKREVAALFVGDVVEEHTEAVKLASIHLDTDIVEGVDIVVGNCYAKANEWAIGAMLGATHLAPDNGIDMALIAVAPGGVVIHYGERSFGKKFGGRGWRAKGGGGSCTSLPPKINNLIVMEPYTDKTSWDWFAPYDMMHWTKTWPEVIQELRKTWGNNAKVALIPDATIQYFSNASCE
jgi:nickel-dependent lactate racemase